MTTPLAELAFDSAAAPPAAAAHEVVHDDCLDALPTLDDGSFDLIYIDPPFNTGRSHEAEAATFDDRWDDSAAYLCFMRTLVEQSHRLLCDSGSILLHCDWRTCHHLRLLLDEVFGAERFVNHLIWRYGLGGSSPRRFARKHDDILFYAKGESHYFEPPLVPATSNRMRGLMKKATDVLDVPAINNMALERVGYPTQKPLALLELLISACCPPGGRVLDPCCGSGTTLQAAHNLHRRSFGIDRSEQAICIAKLRLEETSKRRNVETSS